MRIDRTIRTLLFAFVFSYFLFSGTVYADVSGQQMNFFVNKKFDHFSRTSTGFTLRSISNRAYFYIEDSYWNNINSVGQGQLLSNISALGDAFDNVIYSKETSFFGSEPNPGIDGDPRITILVEDLMDNNGGYFDTANLYRKTNASDNSNEREMLSINIQSAQSNISFIKTFLAHEFLHLISFNQKELLRRIEEDVWFNEMRAEYAVSVAGYNDDFQNSTLIHREQNFIKNPSDSLVEWPNTSLDYAVADMFGQYLAEQYGPDIFAQTLHYNASGISSINQYLSDKGRLERFGDIFTNWMVASYLNDAAFDPRDGYQRIDFKNIHVPVNARTFVSNQSGEQILQANIKPWQPVWFEFDVSGMLQNTDKSLKLNITADRSQNFSVSYLSFFADGTKEFHNLPVIAGTSKGFIPNYHGGLVKAVVFATDSTNIFGFGASERAYDFKAGASMVDSASVQAELLKDGVLIKKEGESELYVIEGKYKRYLTPEVIKLYGHLNPALAIAVSPDVFNSYISSNYVKYVNDKKVYAVWPPDEGSRGGTSTGIVSDGTKHWLNITAKTWDASGRDWNAIFVINDLELNSYRLGADITY